jgi:hypothetical protein
MTLFGVKGRYSYLDAPCTQLMCRKYRMPVRPPENLTTLRRTRRSFALDFSGNSWKYMYQENVISIKIKQLTQRVSMASRIVAIGSDKPKTCSDSGEKLTTINQKGEQKRKRCFKQNCACYIVILHCDIMLIPFHVH